MDEGEGDWQESVEACHLAVREFYGRGGAPPPAGPRGKPSAFRGGKLVAELRRAGVVASTAEGDASVTIECGTMTGKLDLVNMRMTCSTGEAVTLRRFEELGGKRRHRWKDTFMVVQPGLPRERWRSMSWWIKHCRDGGAAAEGKGEIGRVEQEEGAGTSGVPTAPGQEAQAVAALELAVAKLPAAASTGGAGTEQRGGGGAGGRLVEVTVAHQGAGQRQGQKMQSLNRKQAVAAYFDDEGEAARQYDRVARLTLGAAAHLNFPGTAEAEEAEGAVRTEESTEAGEAGEAAAEATESHKRGGGNTASDTARPAKRMRQAAAARVAAQLRWLETEILIMSAGWRESRREGARARGGAVCRSEWLATLAEVRSSAVVGECEAAAEERRAECLLRLVLQLKKGVAKEMVTHLWELWEHVCYHDEEREKIELPDETVLFVEEMPSAADLTLEGRAVLVHTCDVDWCSGTILKRIPASDSEGDHTFRIRYRDADKGIRTRLFRLSEYSSARDAPVGSWVVTRRTADGS
eukprot:gene6777-8100_t